MYSRNIQYIVILTFFFFTRMTSLSQLYHFLAIDITCENGKPRYTLKTSASGWQCNGLWQGLVDKMPFSHSLALSRILKRISKAFSSAPTVPHHFLTTISLLQLRIRTQEAFLLLLNHGLKRKLSWVKCITILVNIPLIMRENHGQSCIKRYHMLLQSWKRVGAYHKAWIICSIMDSKKGFSL